MPGTRSGTTIVSGLGLFFEPEGSMPKIALEWQRFAAFSADELYELLRFRQAIFVVEQASPYPDLDGLDREAWHLLLRVDGRLAGCLRLLPPPALRIGRVAVAADRRRRGLARRLMQTALAVCAEHWPGEAIHLSAQLPLAGFYESLGFAVISEPFDDFGLAHLHMRRR
jgi:ElaA protein